jgi:hypothetical protein
VCVCVWGGGAPPPPPPTGPRQTLPLQGARPTGDTLLVCTANNNNRSRQTTAQLSPPALR